MRIVKCLTVATLIVSGPGWTREPVHIEYALPKTRVAAGVAQVLTACPPSAAQQSLHAGTFNLSIDYTVNIEAKAVPDRLVSLDAHTGFLVDRSSKLTFNDDGLTLKQFNGSRTGQGAAFAASLIKAGAAVFGIAASPLPIPPGAKTAAAAAGAGRPPQGRRSRRVRAPTDSVTLHYLECLPEIAAAVDRLGQVKGEVSALQARAVNGALDAGQTAVLTQLQSEQARLLGTLTLTVTTGKALDPTLTMSGPPPTMTAVLPAPDFDRWFRIVPLTRDVLRSLAIRSDQPTTVRARLETAGRVRGPGGSRPAPLVGFHGYDVAVAFDANTTRWFSCNTTPRGRCGRDDIDTDPIQTRELVYRRGVAATVSLSPRDHDCGTAACPERPDGAPEWVGADQATGSSSVNFPQLSRLSRLPTGGSIFGSATVAATFDAVGRPTSLEYSVGGAGKDVGTVLDAGVGAGQSVAGARLQASKNELDRLTTIESLREALAKQLEAGKN